MSKETFNSFVGCSKRHNDSEFYDSSEDDDVLMTSNTENDYRPPRIPVIHNRVNDQNNNNSASRNRNICVEENIKKIWPF